jgi:hypothetical protein
LVTIKLSKGKDEEEEDRRGIMKTRLLILPYFFSEYKTSEKENKT